MILYNINLTKFKGGRMKLPRKIFEKLFSAGRNNIRVEWLHSIRYSN